MDGLLEHKFNHKISKSSHKKKINRGKKNKEADLCIISANAAQLKGKISSFKSELKKANAGIFTMQESHYVTKGKLKIEDFQIFEAIRRKAKGGTIIGAHKGLNPCLIEEYDNDFELLVIEIKLTNKEIRIISGYGPQENWSENERMPFFLALEQEIIKAEIAGKSVIIEMDANSKLGPNIIPGDMHSQSENGKILADIIQRHNLIVGNGLSKCKGLVTRKRVTKNGIEESIIDFVLISNDLKDDLESILIDDEREHVLTSIKKTKNGIKKIESDHNTIFSRFKFKWNKNIKENRVEMFNLKNKDCQEVFKQATSSINNNKFLSSVFEEKGDINDLTEKFLKRLNKTIHKCFRKVRIKDKSHDTKEDVFSKWRELSKKNHKNNKKEIEQIEEELADAYSKEIYEKIKARTGDIDAEDGGMHSGKLWNLKKEIFPKCREPKTAMLDPKTGNLLTSTDKINEAALNVFKERLNNSEIKEHLKPLKQAKEKLCKKVLQVAAENKTPPWKMHELETVLRNLKKQKARDPYDLANDIFRIEVAGDDLKEAILKMMNRIKDEQCYPKCLELCNVSSIWKKKKSRNDFESYRGIFRVTIFRSILDRLIYNDEIKNIDENLTDCNVGARKHRNIRDNIFVMNAILNSNQKEHEEALDIQIYDIEKCFDKLWLHEVINSLYEAGLRNDKLPLLFLENKNAQVAVKTNGQLSNRTNIKEIIMQGSVWGSICCVVLMDKLGKYAYNNPETLFYYKSLVGTPPLQMVDDIMAIQKCDSKSLYTNNMINTFMDIEKLSLSKTKCHKIHIGKQKSECPVLKVDGDKMHDSIQEVYLGDIIHRSKKNKPNIERRKAKGYGIINEILVIVNEIPLAHWKVKSGLQLRQAMLINGILFNTEAWHNISDKDIIMLEKVDEALLRGLLSAHSKTPLEALYLETGCLPIRFILKSRRLMYLHNILQKSDNEMIKKIYKTQKENPSLGDFSEIIKDDKKTISLNLTETEISNLRKNKFKEIVKKKVRDAAFEYLNTLKQKHSKMTNITYESLKVKPYLTSPIFNLETRNLLFRLRTRTVSGIRADFKGIYSDLSCPLECGDNDSLENILSCKILLSFYKNTSVCHGQISYSDVFSDNIKKQQEVTELFRNLLEIRNERISQPVVRLVPCIV